MITIKLTNKLAYTLIAILVILTLTLIVYAYNQPIPNPGHPGDSVWITTPADGEMDLQTAITEGKLATVPSQFTTCTQLLTTTTTGTTPWTAINVPDKCISRPCKMVFKTFKKTNVVNDIRFGDYYQAEDDTNPTTHKWEAYINLNTKNGYNGDDNEIVIVGNNGNYLKDDMKGVETDKYKWSYADDSTTYGMTIWTCNY